MKSERSEIIFVVDRSGSMMTVAEDMTWGFASFIAEQRKIPGDCRVTLTMFNTQSQTIYSGLPLEQVPPLCIYAAGGTALLDAVGMTIDTVGARLRSTPEEDRPGKVIVVIVTDGYENSSKEYTHERIMRMIAHQRDVYQWQFVFLGANQDAIHVAQGYGIKAALTYDSAHAGAMFNAVSSNVARSRSTGDEIKTGGLVDAYNSAKKGGE